MVIAAGSMTGGAVLASNLTAGAATTTPTTPAATAPAGAAPAPGVARPRATATGCPTRVARSPPSAPRSVTINTSSATTTYAVTSSSDIDKNGEANLSDLKRR